jgi:acyl-CoA reductase-like NAD-dependent aldehyde dehydrogenase
LQNLYVHETLSEIVVKRLKEEVGKLVTGDPTDEKTDVGPLITPRDVERVHALVTEAIEKGAKLVIGGKPLDHQCYTPTVLTNVSPKMDVVCKEIFGPVLNVMPYSDLEKVIHEINASNYSFQAAVYAKDIDVALGAAKKLECTACIINNSTAFRVDWMPFGGAKHSGLGIGGIKYGVHDVTQEKLIVIKRAF